MLREKFDEQDCGVDTEIVVGCSNEDCGEEVAIDVPLQSTFFQRRRMRTVDSVKQRKAKLLRAQKEKAKREKAG